ncbi:hypothetical protein BU17DRAFT_70381 [Hysterangium stoloniferum]|nr:hypothetical protein BU17DRAFT_70381 [Hysterangium stoloniferum]
MKGHGVMKKGPAARAEIREGPKYAQMAPGPKPRWTECIDNERKGKGQSLKVKRACASCRADKVQCDVDRPCKRCVKRKIQCVDPCRACGCEVPGCMSCAESSGGTHHHYQESPAEASTSSSSQDKASPTSPSSPLESPLSPYSRQSPHNHAAVCVPQESPAEASTSSSLQDEATPTSPSSPLESPLSPYSHQSLHNHTAVCAPDADSHNSGSQGALSQFSYSHSVPIPDVPDTALSISAALYIPSRSQHNDYEESPGSPMSPLSPDPLQVPSASLYRTTAHPVEPRLYSDGDAQRPVWPASCYPSQRRHSGSYDPPTVSDEYAPALIPLRMHSHPQDETSPASSSLSHPPQSNPTASLSHSTTSSADPLTGHPYYGDAFRHDVGAASGSQPLQRSLPFTSPLTRPQIVHEPPKVTLPSFAEAFPEFVGSSLSNLRAGGRVISYPR